MKKLVILFVGIYFICFSFSCRKKDKDECPVCPKIDALFPASGKKGDTVIISGKNFSSVLLENKVTFNGLLVPAASMISGSTTQLKVLVPPKCGTGPVEIKLDDELYSENGPVFTYEAEAIVTTFAGNPGVSGNLVNGATFASTRFKSPLQLAIDAAGNIYVLDTGNIKIAKLNVATGLTSVLIDNTSQVKNPTAFTVDANNVLYVSHYPAGFTSNAVIYKLTPGAAFPTYYSTDPDAGKKHITMSSDAIGNFYMGRVTTNLSIELCDISHFSSTNGHSRFTSGAGHAIHYKNGFLYQVNSLVAHKIYQTEFSKYNVKDTVETLLLDKTAGLNMSRGVVADDAGNVYIADTQNNRILKYSASGVLTTLLSTGLSLPHGMVIDKSGTIYVASTGNYCIKKIQFE